MIDFEEKYHEFAERRLLEKRAEGAGARELEEMTDGLYDEFAHAKADWLGGASPKEYFDSIDDPRRLCLMIREAAGNGWGVPNVLLDRLYDMGDKAFPALRELAADEGALDRARSDALSMLREMEAPGLWDICLDIIDAAPQNLRSEGEAQAILEDAGAEIKSEVLRHYDYAVYEGKKIYLDMLSRMGPDDEALELLLDAFYGHPGDRSDIALMLGRLGDERALGPLTEVYNAGNMGYVEYMEIRNAIEMLGGVAPESDGAYIRDRDYKKLAEGTDE